MIARHPWYPQVDPELAELVRAEGLTLMGVAAADDAPGPEAEYEQWIASGRHGSMDYLARHAGLKYRPSALVPGCRSILFVAINYYQRAPEWRPGTGRVARYAWGRDYHKELGKRLKRIARRLGERYPGETFRAFTDATPLAERHYAEQAGIAFTGRHTLLINGELGSWFVVGEILSTREWRPSEPAAGRHGACPSRCRRCLDVCPTGALEAPHRINASRCISYLTIEHDGIIDEELRPLMGEWIFGCDLCQEVCPLNVRAQETGVENFRRAIAGSQLDLARVLAIRDDREFTEMFAGSPLMRARRRRLVRNACIAAANTDRHELLPQLRARAADADEIIAHHARWAVKRLQDPV